MAFSLLAAATSFRHLQLLRRHRFSRAANIGICSSGSVTLQQNRPLMGCSQYCSKPEIELSRARLRARNTRWRKPPPLRGIPGTPKLPRPPGHFDEKEWFVNRHDLPFAPRPPGLKSDQKPLPPERYIDIKK
eukprot:TRINITY_DN5234_c4_g1_i1.p1 TRINITY_DN5234_c4_g1~~TRINITY_DN5234_c4_g1_i1.p1  ORF type:complete len:132 (-),score=20.96 TRINITY_DN5234_c4_g1_i1:141-536(-)